MYNEEGDRQKVFTWPLFANKLLDPITLRLNDKLAVRVLNSHQIFVHFSYDSFKYKINVAKQVQINSVLNNVNTFRNNDGDNDEYSRTL